MSDIDILGLNPVVNGQPLILSSSGMPIYKEEEPVKAEEENEKEKFISDFYKDIPDDFDDICTEHNLGWIQPEEEKEANEFVIEQLGFKPPRMPSNLMAIKLYVRPEEVHSFIDEKGEKKSIVLPESVRASDKYRSIAGLVVAQGPRCYKGKGMEDSLPIRLLRKVFGKWMAPSDYKPDCKVGDFIVFPRHEGVQIVYRDVPLMILKDIKVLFPIKDPRYVTRD